MSSLAAPAHLPHQLTERDEFHILLIWVNPSPPTEMTEGIPLRLIVTPSNFILFGFSYIIQGITSLLLISVDLRSRYFSSLVNGLECSYEEIFSPLTETSPEFMGDLACEIFSPLTETSPEFMGDLACEIFSPLSHMNRKQILYGEWGLGAIWLN